jgi:glycosyltransferase involved in cell wall biosynthesis
LAEIAREAVRRHVLIIVENVSAPVDRRLWLKATALWRNQYNVSVICPKRRRTELAEETIDGIRVFRHPLPFRAPSLLGKLLEFPIALFWELVLSIKIARREQFDIVHICTPPSIVCLIGAIYKFFRKRSVILDYRDTEFGSAGKIDQHGSFIERLAFKIADLCLVANESARKQVLGRGCSPVQKAIVLRPYPDLDRVTPMRPDPTLRNGRAHMVAYAGEVSKTEGVDLLIDAIDYIVHRLERADIQFVIVGTGPEWQEIAGICGKRALGDYVTFTGRVDDETLFTILSSADVCVDPRRKTPQNSVKTSEKMLEYMALGKPIVLIDMQEARLLAADAAHYAENNDPIYFAEKILELIDDPRSRATMGKIGQERARNELSWDREQRKLLIAYDALFQLREKRSAERKPQKPPTAQKSKASKKK